MTSSSSESPLKAELEGFHAFFFRHSEAVVEEEEEEDMEFDLFG